MSDVRSSEGARVRGRADAGKSRSVAPVFPLILLETLRDTDHPSEVLEDEDVSVSMPRRLGLSDVVLLQIQKFKEAVRQKHAQPSSVVEDLLRLVLRRPDAEVIFEEAGRRVARHYWAQRSGLMRGTIRFMPRPISLLAAARAGRRMFRHLTGNRSISMSRWPVELRIADPVSVRADPGGAACDFYAGALSEMLKLYTGRPYRVLHSRCMTRGAPECEWTVELAG